MEEDDNKSSAAWKHLTLPTSTSFILIFAKAFSLTIRCGQESRHYWKLSRIFSQLTRCHCCYLLLLFGSFYCTYSNTGDILLPAPLIYFHIACFLSPQCVCEEQLKEVDSVKLWDQERINYSTLKINNSSLK